MSPMFKQKVGMTKIYAKGIAELFLIRCNPYHWDGSGEVPDNISFDVYKRKIDETYDGCTLEIQLCKPDGCLCYAASVHLYEGGFGLSKWMTSRHHLLVQKVRLLVSMIPVAS